MTTWGGLTERGRQDLGKWFKARMVDDVLFPNPAYILKFNPDATGDAERMKELAVRRVEEIRARYAAGNYPLPKTSVYATSGRKFWYCG